MVLESYVGSDSGISKEAFMMNPLVLKAFFDYSGSRFRIPVTRDWKLKIIPLTLLLVDQQPGTFWGSACKDMVGAEQRENTKPIPLVTEKYECLPNH